MTVALALMAGASIVSGIAGMSAANKAAKNALAVGSANAEDLRSISGANAAELERIGALNAGAILGAADVNARSITEVARANSIAILDATLENIDLAREENVEMLRRHIKEDAALQGEIRATTGASGVRVGSGSPLEVLVDAAIGAYEERQYMGRIGAKQVRAMGNEGTRRAKLTMLDAEQRAQTMMSVAGMQAFVTQEEARANARIMVRDAEANAAAMERGSGAMASSMRAQGTANLIAGIAGATNAYAMYGSPSYTGITSYTMP